MRSQNRLGRLALLLLSIVALVAANAFAQPKPPAPPAKPPPKPTLTQSASASAAPSAAPELPSATPEASSAPSAAPSATPSASPSVSPSAAPVASAEPVPPAVIVVPTPVPSALITEAKPAETVNAQVMLHETNVLTLHLAYRGETAEQRAKAATKALEDVADDAKPEDVRFENALESDGTTVVVIYVKKAPILRLTKDDAAASSAPLSAYADAVVESFKKALRADKEKSALAGKIFSISLVVLLFIAMIFLVRKLGDLAQRGNQWIEDHPERIPAIRVRSLEVIHPGTLRGALSVTLGYGKWVVQIAIVYLWIIVALSMFESTRKYTGRLTGFIVEPFGALFSRFASTLPLFLVGGIALLAMALSLRVVQLFFESVASGKTMVAWLPADLARPTSILARGGLILAGLVFAAPLITGNAEGALPRVGLVAICGLGLASVPLAATALLGVVAVYGRRLKPGEFVELDGRLGKLARLGFLDLTIRGEDGVETRVPHFLWLIRPTRVLGPTPRVAVHVRLGRDAYSPALRERLLGGLGAMGAEPSIDVVSIDPAAIELSVSVRSSESVKARLNDLVLEATVPRGLAPKAPPSRPTG